MIECIPNFSEGRRLDVIDAIATTIRAVPGVYLLDTHSDADHNRSVITFAGEREAVGEAAFRAVAQAAQLIDLNEQRGQHPRIGATDVLPFVPLAGATMAEAVALAGAVGRRIGAQLGIPVYLYGAAATSTERRELPNLRKGDYEGLRTAIQHDPARAPDFGPQRLGPAGATIVGVRPLLIAYNLFLNTADLAIAKQIAKAVRGSSGGLRGVRALGMLVDGRAQVSLNLTDFTTTPVHRAVEMVVREATNYGISVTTGELVGLIPEDALIAAGRASLRLPQLTDSQILERRLDQVIAATSTRPGASTLRARLQTHNAEHAAKAPPVLAQALRLDDHTDTIWTHAVQALAISVQELAASGASGRVRTMLRVLARELLDLAAAEHQEPSATRLQTLLLIARHAIKATETLAPNNPTQPQYRALRYFAHTVTTTAQQRAQALLDVTEPAQRALIAEEFAAYTYRVGELLTRDGA